MGRKTDLIAELRADLREAEDGERDADDQRRALGERCVDARRVIEAMVDLDFARIPQALLDRARAWLDVDPRPDDPTNRLHYLQVEGGDALVWRLVSELIALHDAEAARLGEPRWADRVVDVRCPDCGRRRSEERLAGFAPVEHDPTLDVRLEGEGAITHAYRPGEAPEPPEPKYDPPEETVGVGDLVRLRLGDAGTAYVEVSAIDWSDEGGWRITAVSPGEHPS